MMEKVKCAICGNIGYTAAPDEVRCSECGLKRYVIVEEYENDSILKAETVHDTLSPAEDSIRSGRFLEV